jgi:hypothetical protein
VSLDRVRYRARESVFEVPEKGRFTMRKDERLVLPMDILDGASATQLRNAVVTAGQRLGMAREIFFSTVPFEGFDPETAPIEDFAAAIDPVDDEFNFEAYVYLDPGEEFIEDTWRRLVEPLLERRKAAWHGSWTDDDYGPGLLVALVGRFPTRGRSVRDLFETSREFQELVWAATKRGELTAARCVALIRGGHISALIGQPESNWIDVKARPHRVSTRREKLELAKDVAAFANSGEDAVIVFGAATKDTINGEVVDAAIPFDLDEMSVQALADTLSAWIVPPILDLEVEAVESEGGLGYGFIFIPSQEPSTLPVLVNGAVIDERFIGTLLAIPLRFGQRTVYADAARVHSLIAAGRAALTNRQSKEDD